MQQGLVLLTAALDASGYICIRGLADGKQPVQRFFNPGDYAGAVQFAEGISARGYNAYFATSTFLVNTGKADAANVNAVKCFKIDLDVGIDDAKKYPSKKAAAAALITMCQNLTLPLPTVVDSGGGLHVYWMLEEALTPSDGKLYSEMLKQVLKAHHMIFDPTATGDIARILRVPGTLNMKPDLPPRPVKIVKNYGFVPTDDMLDLIDALYAQAGAPTLPNSATALPALMPGMGAVPAHLRNESPDAATKNLVYGGKPKSFAVLLRRSMDGDGKRGCAQIRDIYVNQATMSEDRWRAGLSVARWCVDGPTAIHDMSRNYPTYSHADTEEKASKTKGPFHCTTFKSMVPSLCDGCPNFGKITSPIQLGEHIPKAKPGDSLVIDQNKSIDPAPQTYTIPTPPYPYIRREGPYGGIYLQGEDEDDGDEICKYPLYMVRRLWDEHDKGFMAHLRMHHPQDGVLDFMVPASVLGSKQGLQEIINKQGILQFDREAIMVRNYVRRWYEFLEGSTMASKVKMQFGWTDDHASFVLGDKELLPSQRHTYSAASPSLAPQVMALAKKGTFEAWRKGFNVLGTPQFEQHAFCALTGFGSILLNFTKLEGALINAFSEDTGTGKTTSLYAACSIWGNPKALMLTAGEDGDTPKSRLHRAGVYKNLPMCIDEITDLPGDEMSSLVFSISNGRGPNRMKASSNEERVNTSTWQLIALSTANTNFSEKLQAHKTGVNGQLARLIEIEIPKTEGFSKEQWDEVKGAFLDNYGHAGEMFVWELYRIGIPNVINRLQQLMRELDAEAKLTGQERYWSAIGVCNLLGGIIANEAGIIDIPMDNIRKFYVRHVQLQRSRVAFVTTASKSKKQDLLGMYMGQHQRDTLTVDVDDAKKLTTVLKEPTGELLLRYERNKGRLFVEQSAFRKFFTGKNEHLQRFLEDQQKQGTYIGETKKRMGSGTLFPSQPVRTYEFKLDDGVSDGDQ